VTRAAGRTIKNLRTYGITLARHMYHICISVSAPARPPARARSWINNNFDPCARPAGRGARRERCRARRVGHQRACRHNGLPLFITTYHYVQYFIDYTNMSILLILIGDFFSRSLVERSPSEMKNILVCSLAIKYVVWRFSISFFRVGFVLLVLN
jgi:hypothetical protein